jgi:hypothetical protein
LPGLYLGVPVYDVRPPKIELFPSKEGAAGSFEAMSPSPKNAA